MPKHDIITLDAVVLKALPNTVFCVRLENNMKILATVSGRIRMNYIRILPGDRVKVELSPYDLEHGRIIFRAKNTPEGVKK